MGNLLLWRQRDEACWLDSNLDPTSLLYLARLLFGFESFAIRYGV
jgi:hypothetical protein